eukprot:UN13843
MNAPVETIMNFLQRPGRNRSGPHGTLDEVDQDPYLLQESKVGETYPTYQYKDYALPRGIRPDQLRYKFTGEDLEAVGLDSKSDDYKLIYGALSYHNAGGREILGQLKANEIAGWGFHPFDTGRLEVQICCMTLKMRRMHGQIVSNRFNGT